MNQIYSIRKEIKDYEEILHFYKNDNNKAIPAISFFKIKFPMAEIYDNNRIGNKFQFAMNCNASCWATCEGSCTNSCYGSCTGECTGSCSNACTGNCTGSCSGSCSNSSR